MNRTEIPAPTAPICDALGITPSEPDESWLTRRETALCWVLIVAGAFTWAVGLVVIVQACIKP